MPYVMVAVQRPMEISFLIALLINNSPEIQILLPLLIDVNLTEVFCMTISCKSKASTVLPPIDSSVCLYNVMNRVLQ